MKKQLFLFGRSGKMGQSVSKLNNKKNYFTFVVEANKADIFLDFSVAEALDRNLALAKSHKCPLVIGTTGHTSDAFKKMEEASRDIPLFYASNFSLGISLMLHALKQLETLLPDHHLALEETHPTHKKDAPSGTALMLAKEMKFDPEKIISHRIGDQTFSHTVSFSFGDEMISIKHEATSREVFAVGALTATSFLLNQRAGLYSMKDMLKL